MLLYIFVVQLSSQTMSLFVWKLFIVMLNYWIDILEVYVFLFYFLYKNLKVCELDIIFNFEKAYFILDEFLLAGEVQETSKKQVLKAISAQDLLQDVSF